MGGGRGRWYNKQSFNFIHAYFVCDLPNEPVLFMQHDEN